MSGRKMSSGRMSGGRMSGRISGGRMSGSKMSGGRTSGGKMSGREFEKCLRAAMKGGEPERRKRLCGVQRGIGPRTSFREFVLVQIRFIGLRMWAAQAALFAALGSVLWTFMGRDFWQEDQYAVRFLCGVSLAAAVSALPFIYRAFRYRMHEIEASSRYSFAGVLLAKMLMTAIGDAALLGAVFLGALMRTELPAGSILLYVLLPFLLASWLSLNLMERVSAAALPAACMAMGALLFAALGTAGRLWEGFYVQELTPGWLAVCAVLTMLCIRQAKRLVRDAVYLKPQTA